MKTLDYLLKTGVLPTAVSETGADHEPLTEILICDSISGGARYRNNMPKQLTLVRYLADGTEYRSRYEQVNEPEA